MNAYLLFFSNNHVIWASRLLKEASIEHKMVAVPRDLSSDCGFCLHINNSNQKQILSLLDQCSVEYDRIDALTL